MTLPLAELRAEGLVFGGGSEPLEIEETVFRVERFDRDVWQVVRTDEYDYAGYMKQSTFCEQAETTVEA